MVRAQEEEGCGHEEGADDDVGLDGGLLVAVAQIAPNWGGNRVGAVFQAEEEADVKWREVEFSKNLS